MCEFSQVFRVKFKANNNCIKTKTISMCYIVYFIVLYYIYSLLRISAFFQCVMGERSLQTSVYEIKEV